MKSDYWKFILTKIRNNRSVLTLIVADSSGSAPGRQGFKMVISDDGEMIGTIGGGKIEFDLVEEAKLNLSNSNPFCNMKRFNHNIDSEDSSGMICGGSQDIIQIKFTPTDQSLIEEIYSSVESGNFCVLNITKNGCELDFNSSMKSRFNSENKDGVWKYSEIVSVSENIYIFGAGHVGEALAKLMSDLNFNVTLIDHRMEVFNSINNYEKIKCRLINDYSEAKNLVSEGNNSYAVIVTFEHAGDEAVLESLINKKLKYLGMMGSKKKVKSIKDNLIKKGIKEENLNKIYSPIGIKIKSETHTEIAVSIAAEIISVKNSNKDF